MYRHRIATLGAMLVSCALPLSQADEFEQHAAHEHGHVTLNIVVQDELLSVELDTPAINVLGFEHEPRSSEERERFAQQQRWLASGRGAVGVPASARCRLERVDVSAPHWDASPHDDHAAEADSGEHGDYRVTWRFRCAAPGELAWLEPWLLEKLADVDEVEVNLVNGELQKRLAASGARQRIALRP